MSEIILQGDRVEVTTGDIRTVFKVDKTGMAAAQQISLLHERLAAALKGRVTLTHEEWEDYLDLLGGQDHPHKCESAETDARHREFYRRLASLLDEFDVDINATDTGEPYGQHLPLIEVQFDTPYRSDEMNSLTADGCRERAEEGE